MISRSLRFAAVLALLAAACTGSGPVSFDLPPRETALAPPLPGSVRGHVAFGAGVAKDFPKAGIAFRLAGEESPPAQSTDVDGAFLFASVPAGDYVLSVADPAFSAAPVPVTVPRGGAIDLGEVVLTLNPAARGRISGEVRVKGGAGSAAGALVEALREPNEEPFGAASAGSTGAFSLELPAGSYHLRASHPSYVTAERTGVLVKVGGTTALEQPLLLDVDPATLTGTVLRESDFSAPQPAVGAQVSVDDGPAVAADVNGRFAFTQLTAGTHAVRVTLTGYRDDQAPRIVRLESGPSNATDLRVVLSRERGTVNGTVSLSDGKPAQGISVTLASLEGTFTAVATPSPGAPSVGRFSFPRVPAGTWTITADRERYASKSDTVTLAAGAVVEVPTLKLTLQQGDFLVEDKDPSNTPGFTRTRAVTLRFLTLPQGTFCYRVSESEAQLDGTPSADAGTSDGGAASTLPCLPIPANAQDDYTLASAQEGTREIFVQFEDGSGKRSLVLRSTIVLDTKPPTLDFKVEGGTAFTNRAQFLGVTLDGTDVASAGADTASSLGYVVFNLDGALAGGGASADAGTPDASSSGTSASALCAAASTALAGGTLAGSRIAYARDQSLARPSSVDGPVRVFAQVYDNAGNPSPIVCREIVVDTVKPTADFTLERGVLATASGFTSSPIATLTMNAAAEPFGGALQVRLAGSPLDLANAVYQPLRPSMAFFLDNPTVDGTKDVYAQFRDSAGNELTVPKQSIVLDLTPPTLTVQVPAATTSTQIAVGVTASDNHGLSPTEAVTVSEDPFFASTGTLGPRAYTPGVPVTFTLSSGDDLKRVNVRVKDAAGNQVSRQQVVRLDRTAPFGTLVAGDGSGFWNKAQPVPVSAVNASADLASLAVSSGALDCATATYAPLATAATLALADGRYTVSACLKDDVGNFTATPLAVPLVVDTVAPAGTVDVPPVSAAPFVTVTLTVTDATSGPAQMEITEAASFSGAWVAFSPVTQLKLSGSEGSHVLRGRVMDRAGNIGVLTPGTVSFDKTPPGGSVGLKVGSVVSPAFTTTRSVTLVHTTAPDVVDVAVANDAIDCLAPPAPGYHAFAATEPFTLPAGDGRKTVAVCYRDAAGNVSSAFTSIVLDTTPPTGALTLNGGVAVTSSSLVSTAISADPDVASMSAVAVGSAPDCTQASYAGFNPSGTLPLTGTGLLNAFVCLKDAAGNVSTTPLKATITRDATPPTGTLQINGSATPSPTNTRAVTLALTAVSDATTSVTGVAFANDVTSLASAPFEPLSAQRSWLLSSGDGAKTVLARLRDQAGNTFDAQAAITLDTAAPTASVTLRSSTGGTAVKTGDDPKTIALSITTSEPTGGTYAFAVRPDLNLPDCASLTTTTAFSSGTAAATYTSAANLQGDTTWYAVACVRDVAGNVTRVTGSILVDQTAPTASFSVGDGSGFTRSTSVPVVFTGASVDLAQVAFAFSAPSSCSAGTLSYVPYAPPMNQTLPTPDGAKTVWACLKDAVGNVGTPLSASVTLDTLAPSGTLALAGGRTATNSTTVTLNITASDATSGLALMELSNTGVFTNNFIPYVAAPVWQIPTGDGTKTISAKLRDRAGNEVTLAPLNISLDTVAPQGTVAIQVGSAVSPAYTNTRSVTLLLSASNDVTQVAVADGRIDCAAASYAAIQPSLPWTLPVTPSGGDPNQDPKVVAVCFRDAAGNTTSASASIVLDTQAPATPSVTILGSESTNQFTKTAATIVSLAASGATQVRLANSADSSGCPTGGVWQSFTSYAAWVLAAGGDGTRSVYVQVRDDAGNVSPCASGTIELDTTPPSAPRFLTPPSYVRSSTFSAQLAAAVTDANFSHYQISVGASGATCSAGFQPPEAYSKSLPGDPGCSASNCYCKTQANVSFPVALVANSANVLRIRAVDKAGNISADDTVVVTHDSVPPTAPGVSAPSRPLNTDSWTLHLKTPAADANPLANYEVCQCRGTSGYTDSCVGTPATCPAAGGVNKGFVGVVGSNDFVVALPADQQTLFFVRGVDVAGNAGASSSTTVISDKTPPTRPTIAQRGEADLVAASVYVDVVTPAVDANGIDHLEFLGGAVTSWTPVGGVGASFLDVPLLRDWPNSVQVRAVDTAGNVGPPSVPLTLNELSSVGLSDTATESNPAIWGDRVILRSANPSSATAALVNLSRGTNVTELSSFTVGGANQKANVNFGLWKGRAVFEDGNAIASWDMDVASPVKSTISAGSTPALQPAVSKDDVVWVQAGDLYRCTFIGCSKSIAITKDGASTVKSFPRMNADIVAFQSINTGGDFTIATAARVDWSLGDPVTGAGNPWKGSTIDPAAHRYFDTVPGGLVGLDLSLASSQNVLLLTQWTYDPKAALSGTTQLTKPSRQPTSVSASGSHALFGSDESGKLQLFEHVDVVGRDATQTATSNPLYTSNPSFSYQHGVYTALKADGRSLEVRVTDLSSLRTVSADGADAWAPDVDGIWAVYLRGTATQGGGALWATNTLMGLDLLLPSLYAPTSPALSGTTVVWSALGGKSSTASEIWACNLTNCVTPMRVSPASPTASQVIPRIDGNVVVWISDDDGDGDPSTGSVKAARIDVTSGTATSLGTLATATSTLHFRDPSVSVVNGRARIVFTALSTGASAIDYWLESSATCTTGKLCVVDGAGAAHPWISGDLIVWDSSTAPASSTTRKIKLWSLTNGFTSGGAALGSATFLGEPLASEAGSRDRVQPRIEGDRVVWFDSRNSGAAGPSYEPFLYDLTREVEVRLEPAWLKSTSATRVPLPPSGDSSLYTGVGLGAGGRVVWTKSDGRWLRVRMWEFLP